MTPGVMRLVLLVSCAHAMVHVYELSLPSVEPYIADEFGIDTKVSGSLGTVWRIPFGFGALLAGWLADRFGCKPMLIVYLLGCVATSLLAWWAPSLAFLFVTMFAMGCFASIYHPAGLAIISRETTPERRGAALGWHGILGSIGIAMAPLIAAVCRDLGVTWREYYLVLMLPGVLLALLLYVMLHERRVVVVSGGEGDGDGGNGGHRGSRGDEDAETRGRGDAGTGVEGGGGAVAPSTVVIHDEPLQWRPYLILVAVGVLSGFIYAALVHFLVRYLQHSEVPPLVHSAIAAVQTGLRWSGMFADSAWLADDWSLTPTNLAGYGATIVLLCGAVGQGIAGKIARPHRLAPLQAVIMFANAVCLLWMATAPASGRLWAAAAMGLFHFMNQPIYNSLVAQYVPHHRRSMGYGFSNMMCFGLGALGAVFAGFMPTDLVTYASLAVVALAATGLSIHLARGKH